MLNIEQLHEKRTSKLFMTTVKLRICIRNELEEALTRSTFFAYSYQGCMKCE